MNTGQKTGKELNLILSKIMWTISEIKLWANLSKFSWVKDMEGVPQSPVYHAEGDVATHTQMVLSALENLDEYKKLTIQEQEIVWAAALMHDIEKRSTTFVDENGNIVSPGHAKKGALTVRQILYREINTPFEIREKVVALVRYHGLPLWIFEKPNPQQSLLKASIEVDTKLLVMLAKADVLGRICEDQQELLYKIDLFKAFCLENDCLGKSKLFPSNLARFEYFRKDNQSPEYEPFENTEFEVIILSGIAGSGKDYYAQKYYPKYEMVSIDNIRRKNGVQYNDSLGNGRAIQEAKELAKKFLRSKTPFVWNATNITSQMRAQLIDLFSVYKPCIKIIYLEVNYKKLLAQNKGRSTAIPEQAIEKMINKLEIPQLWEAHQVEYVIS